MSEQEEFEVWFTGGYCLANDLLNHHLRQFAYKCWQAATEESAKRIAELEAELERASQNLNAVENVATELKEKNAELEGEVAELKEQLSILKPHPLCDTSCLLSCSMEADYAEKQYLENQQLKASNNILREALGQLITHTLECEKRLDEFHGLGDNAGSGCSDVICNSKQALSATPAESLQAHDDELLGKVISTIESLNVDAMFKPVSFSDMFVAIRALKGK